MSDQTLTVLFGTMTGNSEEVATQIHERASELGINSKLQDLADYPAEKLAEETEVVIAISTWGEGEPPDEAEDFYYAIYDQKISAVEKLRYSIVSLGDSSYDDFCGCGRKLDESLKKLGATSSVERVDLDIDFEDGFESWLENYTTYLKSL